MKKAEVVIADVFFSLSVNSIEFLKKEYTPLLSLIFIVATKIEHKVKV